MKYFIQILTLIISGIFSFWVVAIDKNIDMDILNTPTAIINGIGYGALSVTFFVLFVFLIIKERQNKKICFSISQFCCLFAVIHSVGASFLSFYWFHIVQTSGVYSSKINLAYKSLDLFGLWAWAWVAQMVAVSFLGISIFSPLWKINLKRKPIGEYLQTLGVPEDLIEKAREMQEKDEMK